MTKKFGDLNTGDIIYYVGWDEQKKTFDVFEHLVFVHWQTENKWICIDIKIRPGEYFSHRFTDLCLDKNETSKIWGHPKSIKIDDNAIGGLAVSVDYEEAKKICFKFMFEYVQMWVEESKNATVKMHNAVKALADMENKFNN